MAPLVSVIMNCYNGGAFVREAIASVRAQTEKDWEIVFWDDASTDGSGELATSIKDPRVRYFRSPTRVPLGQARTLAYAEARGEFLAVLDVDDFWLPTKLERELSLLQAKPEAGIVHCDTLVLDEGVASHLHFGRHPPPSGFVFRDLLRHYFLFNVAAMVRRTCLGTAPWFDSRLDIVHDQDLLLRVAYNHEVAYVPEVLTHYRVHSGGVSQNYTKLAGEQEIILQGWIAREAGFTREFGKEIREYRAFAEVLLANGYWRQGCGAEARQILARHVGRRGRATLLYGLSYFPWHIWPALRRFYRMKLSPPPKGSIAGER